MTNPQAKKLVREFLDKHNLPYTKVTARTVSFQDLARDSCIFVTVHGWQPSPLWNEMAALAHQGGFCVQTDY